MTLSFTHAQSPKDAVKEFFNALNSKNAEQLSALMADDLKLHSLNIAEDIKLSMTGKKAFINSVGSIPTEVIIEERIFDLESMENEQIASVWVPYEFYVNTHFSHKGVNVFTMVKIDDTWKNTSISDTRVRNKG